MKNWGLGVKFRRQFPIADTPYVVDFCCFELKLAVEVDGGIHQQQETEDQERQVIIENLGYTAYLAIWGNAHFAFNIKKSGHLPARIVNFDSASPTDTPTVEPVVDSVLFEAD